MLPLITFGMQVKAWMGVTTADSRQAAPLEERQVRPIDATTAPVKPFDEPLISVTFDDGWETVYTQAMPLLQKNGIPTTQYVLSGTDKDKNYLSYPQIKAMQAAGHEIACHSVDHANLTKLDSVALQAELVDCKADLANHTGAQIKDFASPYGAFDSTTIAAIKQVYRSQRNTNGDITTNQADDQDINVKVHFDRYNIMAVTIRRETTVEEIQSAIDYTIQHNGWLVLNYHQVDDATADSSQFGIDDATMSQQLAVVSRAKARIVTVGQVLDAMGY